VVSPNPLGEKYYCLETAEKGAGGASLTAKEKWVKTGKT